MPAHFQGPTSIAREIAAGYGIGTVVLAREFSTSHSTILRWVTRGLSDGTAGHVKLEAVRRGRKWITSRPALERFFARLPTNGQPSPSGGQELRTPAQRQRDAERAMADARTLGIA